MSAAKPTCGSATVSQVMQPLAADTEPVNAKASSDRIRCSRIACLRAEIDGQLERVAQLRASPRCRCARRRTGVKIAGGTARDVVFSMVAVEAAG